MRYTVHSRFAKAYDAMAGRFQRWPVLHAICRLALRLTLPIAWLGLLISSAVCFGVPFKILHWCQVTPPSKAYWFWAAIISGGVLFCCYRLGRRVLHELRHRIIDIESLVGLAGFTLSLAWTIWLFRTGWPD